jgi:uncharacterized protein DUF998
MAKSAQTQLQPFSQSRFASQATFLASAAFIALLAALHVLRPDLDPSWRFISEYELGDFGWLMRLAFGCLAVSCLTLCWAIVPYLRGVIGYVGIALVLLAAFGMALAAVFAPHPVNRLHEVGAMLDHLPFGAPLVNWGLARNPAWKRSRRMLLVTAFLPLLGLIVFIASMAIMLPRNDGKPGPNVLVGWPNRVMILAHCAWIMPLAWHSWRHGSMGNARSSEQ